MVIAQSLVTSPTVTATVTVVFDVSDIVLRRQSVELFWISRVSPAGTNVPLQKIENSPPTVLTGALELMPVIVTISGILRHTERTHDAMREAEQVGIQIGLRRVIETHRAKVRAGRAQLP